MKKIIVFLVALCCLVVLNQAFAANWILTAKSTKASGAYHSYIDSESTILEPSKNIIRFLLKDYGFDGSWLGYLDVNNKTRMYTTIQSSEYDVYGNTVYTKQGDGNVSGQSYTASATTQQRTPPPAAQTAEGPDGFYGTYYRCHSLWEAAIGRYAGYMQDIRFRAKYSGMVRGVKTIFLTAVHIYIGRPGYSLGNGGDIRCRLMTDDGNGRPSGTVLAEFVIYAANNTLSPTPNGWYWGEMKFDSPGYVEAGKVYHLVWDNLDTSTKNFSSFDNLSNFEPNEQMQPGYEDMSLALLESYNGLSGMTVMRKKTPVYSLYYTDGRMQGQAYIYQYDGYARNVQGSTMVRSHFTVTGGNRPVGAVHVAVKKSGTPGGLTIRLEEGNGTLIEQATISQSKVSSTEANWVGFQFSKPHFLENGKTYNLRLSAPAGEYYLATPLQDGTGIYGIEGDTFKDGEWQYSTDGGSSWNYVHSSLDLMGYFTLSGSTPPPSSDIQAPSVPTGLKQQWLFSKLR